MIALRKHGVVSAAIVGSLTLAPVLVGCSNPLETVVEGVTGGNVDIGGTSIPGDFPAEVPLIDGEVVSAFGLGKDAEKAFTIVLKVSGASVADEIKAQLEGAGFTSEFDQDAGGVAGSAYTNANYGVLVAVTENGDNGWIATYVVTPAGS